MSIPALSLTPAPRHDPQPYSAPQPQRHLRLVEAPQLSIDDIMSQRATTRSGADRGFGPIPSAESDLPGVHAFARSFFTALTEVMVGRRSVDQLSRHTALPVLQWIRSLTPHRPANARPAAAPRLRAVHLCRVRDGVIEATAVVQHGPHVRAVNARFLGLDQRWQCTNLQIV